MGIHLLFAKIRCQEQTDAFQCGIRVAVEVEAELRHEFDIVWNMFETPYQDN
jgi:hypothetical protein